MTPPNTKPTDPQPDRKGDVHKDAALDGVPAEQNIGRAFSGKPCLPAMSAA